MSAVVIHRNAVRALLISPETEILMMQLRDPETAHRFWITPGGGLLDEELPETGLRRELSEEVGLRDFTAGPLVWKRQHTFNWAGRRICQRERIYVVRTEAAAGPCSRRSAGTDLDFTQFIVISFTRVDPL